MDYGSGGAAADNGLFTSGQETAQAASEYSTIAVGNIQTSVDNLHTAEAAVQAGQAALRQQQAQDSSDASRQAGRGSRRPRAPPRTSPPCTPK